MLNDFEVLISVHLSFIYTVVFVSNRPIYVSVNSFMNSMDGLNQFLSLSRYTCLHIVYTV